MRTFALLLTAAGVALAALVGPPPRRPAAEAEARRVAGLIDQLNDDSYARREATAKALEQIGAAALPALRKAAADHKDIEVRRRAEQVARDLVPSFRLSKTTGAKLVLLDAGEFQMGSPRTEANRRADEALHKVRITRPFYLGQHEVTQAEYQKVMKANPSYFTRQGEGKDKLAGVTSTADFPVEQVTWFDAVEFCNRLSKLDGLRPYYKLADVKEEKGAITAAAVTVLGGPGYRLPTEAEWEFACRANSSKPFHFGDANTGKEANVKPTMVSGGYGGSYPKFRDMGRTTKVGSYPSNAWGLYDMHGNVAEWCHDRYDYDYYANSPRDDPPGHARGPHRVLRGGHWLITEGSCRSASRFSHAPAERKYYAGFRIARAP